MSAERVFVLRIPDWPPGTPPEHLRQDPGLAERLFHPVLSALAEITPGIEVLHPGACALRGRGPTRYYGSEEAAAETILTCVFDLGLTGARLGIADGLFTARQAAAASENAPGILAPSESIRIVQAGTAREFLAPLPIERAAEAHLARTLRGLGIRTLGALAALPEQAVRSRFGDLGVAAHRRAHAAPPAHGSDITPTAPTPDFTVEITFDHPVSAADQLAFACAQIAERCITQLAQERLVCTAMRIEITDHVGVRHERVWNHPRSFTAADAINRVRWQLDALPRSVHDHAAHGAAGITTVRLSPEQTDRAASHDPTLWSTGPDERMHHRFTQVQSRLGHAEIGTAQLCGGRLLTERQHLIAWGTTARPRRDASGPWPGSLPRPLPSRVFDTPLTTDLRDAAGTRVILDADGLLATQPDYIHVVGEPPERVTDWSLPWPIRERWWEGQPMRWRLQAQTTQAAWLLLHEHGRWFTEGKYE